MSHPPDWRLPPGVNRGLWDYLHDPGVARNYDAYLQGSSLFDLDIALVRERCRGPGLFLDLGCGSGRLLVALARDGWRPVGVDLSAEMLAVARDKAAAEGLVVDLVRANLVDLAALASGSFDASACLFSTLGMVLGADNRRRVVAEAFRLLRPGGRFVLHVHNRYHNLRDKGGRRWLFGDLWRRLLRRPDAGDWVMPVHQGIAGLTLHLFTRGEAVALLKEAGFRAIDARPISTTAKGRLPLRWLLPGLRAYGYLLVAERP